MSATAAVPEALPEALPEAAAKPARNYVPAGLDVADWSQIEPVARELQDRAIGSTAELEKWLLDYSELASVIDEYGARRYIAKSCHTDDEAIEKAFMHFVENIEPKFKPVETALRKKFLASPHRTGLTDRRYEILSRGWQADVDIFRDENVPLEVEATKIISEYDKLCGAMQIEFRGKTYTPQQLGRFVEETDRATREAAWRAGTERRLKDRAATDGLFDRLVPLRHKIATNAGMSDFRAYMWKSLKRFDYSPDDCLRFNDAIARIAVPAVRELDRRRKAKLGVEQLRPWDAPVRGEGCVDPLGRPPLQPFDPADIDGFVATTHKVFQQLNPALADEFDSLRRHGNLDLGSRKGKQPGGYQSTLNEVRQPFIFMNAAGSQGDVETMIHEGGHAFHAIAAREEPLVFLRHAPMEFCEVASMGMELLAQEHLGAFYRDEADLARAKRIHLEGIVRFFPWMATIDAFQHWLYTHPTHAAAERDGHWLSLMDRFNSSEIDWTGLTDARAAWWQRQMHLFHVPFYYVEYGIAQLGALQLWLMSRENPHRALSHYRAALKLGGTRSLPELFSAAGIRFDFSERTFGPLIEAVQEELASLPE
jgi:oligoendopeptidase F